MPNSIELVAKKGKSETYRVNIDALEGWSTRSFPHALPPGKLQTLDNFLHLYDNIWSKRGPNTLYGGGTGATGSGVASLSGARFYSGTSLTTAQLCVQSGGHFYTGVDATGAFTSRNAGMSTTQAATYAQMYDPDNVHGAASTLFICDGSRAPQYWDGTNFGTVQEGGSFLPNGQVSGVPITPLYVAEWGYNLAYANEPSDPGALWISDTLRPQRFTSQTLQDSAGTTYFPYYPAGRDTAMGVITGIVPLGPLMVIFFTTGVVTAWNTGSYGAFQYVFQRISNLVGSPAPRSIVRMGGQVFFFGGDRFYATDGQSIVPLTDDIPTVYATQTIYGLTPDIGNIATVTSLRRSNQYWASYDTGSGTQTRLVVFDTTANGGWQFGSSSGGAWSRWPSGMSLSWGLQCVGPGDTSYPVFWGDSGKDLIYQNDLATAGNAGDNGAAIACNILTKSFFLDKPAHIKTIEKLYIVMVYPTPTTGSFTTILTPYVEMDQVITNFSTQTITIAPQGIFYGGGHYYGDGSVYGGGGSPYQQFTVEAFPEGKVRGRSFAVGLMESSLNPLNIISFVAVVTVDPPEE